MLKIKQFARVKIDPILANHLVSIATGKQMEYLSANNDLSLVEWVLCKDSAQALQQAIEYPEGMRVAKAKITVNGFVIDAPLKVEEIEDGQVVFEASPGIKKFYLENTFDSSECMDILCANRGLFHATAEAAVAHAMAMIGVDPNSPPGLDHLVLI